MKNELQFIQQEITRLEKRLRDLRDKVLHPLSEAIEPQKDILAIQRIVAEFFGLSVEDLSSGSRSPSRATLQSPCAASRQRIQMTRLPKHFARRAARCSTQ